MCEGTRHGNERIFRVRSDYFYFIKFGIVCQYVEKILKLKSLFLFLWSPRRFPDEFAGLVDIAEFPH